MLLSRMNSMKTVRITPKRVANLLFSETEKRTIGRRSRVCWKHSRPLAVQAELRSAYMHNAYIVTRIAPIRFNQNREDLFLPGGAAC